MVLIMLPLFGITAIQNHLITAHKEINHKYFGMVLKADTTCLYSTDESHYSSLRLLGSIRLVGAVLLVTASWFSSPLIFS